MTHEPDIDEIAMDESLALADTKAEHIHDLAYALHKILGWLYGKERGDQRGVMLRAYVLCWQCLPQLRQLNQTELAKIVGLKCKASINRQVGSFERKFPGVLAGLRTAETREKCRQRELSKSVTCAATHEQVD
jgi:hypothetical protein